MANDFTRAEQAGKDYFCDHPDSNHAEATHFARKAYTIVLQRELFVAGWNDAFWSEQARVLKARHCKVEQKQHNQDHDPSRCAVCMGEDGQ